MANSIQYDYKILDRYSGPLRKIKRATDRVNQSVKKAAVSVDRLGNKFKNAGSKMASMQGALAGIGAGIALKNIVDITNRFETAMNSVNAITLTTAENMIKLREQAKTLGATTQFSASQSADAMGFLGMAGLNVTEIMQAMPGTLQLAAAGSLELSQAADIATNVLAQMGLKVSQLGKVNDALAMTASSANTNVLEMAEALKNVGTTASGLGIGLNLTSAMIGKMADAGVKGGEAGTLLRNAMTRTINPSKKARKAFKKLRIDLKNFRTPDGKLKNFTGLIEKLKTAGATTQDMFTIFEERGARAIMALLASGGPAIDKLKKKLDGAKGAADAMAKIKMEGLPGAIKKLASSFEAVKIAIGEKITPHLIKFMGKLSGLFSILSASPKMAVFIALILSLGAAIPLLMIPLGLLISSMGTLMTVIAGISWPIIAAIAGVAAVSAAFIYWNKTGHPIIKTLKHIGSLAYRLLKPFTALFNKFNGGSKLLKLIGFSFKMTGFFINLMLKPIEIVLIAFSGLFDIIEKIINLDFKGALGSYMETFEKAASIFGFGDKTEIESKKVIENAIDIKKQSKQSLDITGGINVAASKGSEVVSSWANVSLGGNMLEAL